ncbi:MAG: hypothetical protein R3F20_02460 [Planctomycetota bacterium]
MAGPNKIVGIVNAAIEDANRQILNQSLSALPRETRIGELVDGLQETDLLEDFRAMLLSDFLAAVGGGSRPGRKPGRPAKAEKSAGAAKGGKASKGKKRNTRTQAGRDEIDADIQIALEGLGEPSPAEAIRKITGGTSAQVRDSLARLVEAKVVKKAGERRATRYALK